MTEDRAATPTGLELVGCEMPGGCANVIEYAGVGRRPKYCGELVDGVLHSRYNAYRVNKKLLTLPAPGSRPGRLDEPAAARPVSLARASIEALRDEIGETVASHQQAIQGLLTRFEEAVATATDPDAAAAEVAAAHREARSRIDAAEAVAEDATTRLRAAETAEATARTAQATAESAADQALSELDDQRDQCEQLANDLAAVHARLATVEGDRDAAASAAQTAEHENTQLHQRLAGLAAAHDRVITELRDVRAQLAAAHQQVEDRTAERDTARTEAAAQRARAETAERDAARQETTIASLSTQLEAARGDLAERIEQVSTARGDLATAVAQAAGLREQVDRERVWGEQRLTDQRDRHAEQLGELRAQLADLQAQLTERQPSRTEGADPPSSPPDAPAGPQRRATTSAPGRGQTPRPARPPE